LEKLLEEKGTHSQHENLPLKRRTEKGGRFIPGVFTNPSLEEWGIIGQREWDAYRGEGSDRKEAPVRKEILHTAMEIRGLPTKMRGKLAILPHGRHRPRDPRGKKERRRSSAGNSLRTKVLLQDEKERRMLKDHLFPLRRGERGVLRQSLLYQLLRKEKKKVGGRD